MKKLLFLYASQSGNAESIAKLLCHTAATEKGLIDPSEADARCMTLNDAEKKGVLVDRSKSEVVVLVVATHGEGDYPDNGQRMKRWLKKAKTEEVQEDLAELHYTVLALGDTNYETFCQSGKNCDTRLCALGAHRFYPRGEADDGTGLETVVDPWIAGLWPVLSQLMETPTVLPSPLTPKQSHALPRDTSARKKLLFLYASQSGNAESIAKLLCHTAATEKGLIDPSEADARCMTLNDAEKKGVLVDRSKSEVVVLVVATHGEGDYPDNGQRMKRWLKKAKTEEVQEDLAELHYTVLALGPHNFTLLCSLCNVPSGNLFLRTDTPK